MQKKLKEEEIIENQKEIEKLNPVPARIEDNKLIVNAPDGETYYFDLLFTMDHKSNGKKYIGFTRLNAYMDPENGIDVYLKAYDTTNGMFLYDIVDEKEYEKLEKEIYSHLDDLIESMESL